LIHYFLLIYLFTFSMILRLRPFLSPLTRFYTFTKTAQRYEKTVKAQNKLSNLNRKWRF